MTNNELWERRRQQLEQALLKAAADLLDHMGGVNRLGFVDHKRGIRISVGPADQAPLQGPTARDSNVETLATAVGLRLDVLASLIPPNGVPRLDGEPDQDFRERATGMYRAYIAAVAPERCKCCGTDCPCACGGNFK